MPASLANRVRGEQVPLNGVHLRLLEVIVDEERRPLWRARCLQTGDLLTVALDGLVQVPVPNPASDPDDDYLGERRRSRRRLRWKLGAGSVVMAILAFVFRDQLMSWAEAFRAYYQANR